MKIFYALLFSVLSHVVFSQNADTHLKNGIDKHLQKNYEGAIADYTKAIKIDKTLKAAYYNRGICALANKDLKNAEKDFTQAIALDPQYIEAYYSRAGVRVNQERYKDALLDLDQTIGLNPSFPNAFTLRGQIRVQTDNKMGGCADFEQAQKNGDPTAIKYLEKFCSTSKLSEKFILDWPKEEKWKVGSDQENEDMKMLEYIYEYETFDTWTEIGTMTVYKNSTNLDVNKAMHLMYGEALKKSPKSVLTFIEKSEDGTYPWIIFAIESPKTRKVDYPESQVWQITQGKKAMYVNIRAVKKETLTPAQKSEWTAFFKTGRIE